MKSTRESALRISKVALITLVILEAILIFGVVVPRVLARTTPAASSNDETGGFHE